MHFLSNNICDEMMKRRGEKKAFKLLKALGIFHLVY